MTADSRGADHRYPAQTRRRARRLFAQHGWATAAIAQHLDVPVDRVRAWVADLRPTNGNARRYDRAAILMDATRMTRAELREKHGCSSRFLSDLLNGKLDPTSPTEPELDHP